MRHKIKKLLACVLSLVMALSLMSGVAFAAETDSESSSSGTSSGGQPIRLTPP